MFSPFSQKRPYPLLLWLRPPPFGCTQGCVKRTGRASEAVACMYEKRRKRYSHYPPPLFLYERGRPLRPSSPPSWQSVAGGKVPSSCLYGVSLAAASSDVTRKHTQKLFFFSYLLLFSPLLSPPRRLPWGSLGNLGSASSSFSNSLFWWRPTNEARD